MNRDIGSACLIIYLNKIACFKHDANYYLQICFDYPKQLLFTSFTDGQVDGWMDACIVGWMNGWMNEYTDGWMAGWMDVQMDELMDRCMDGWMDGNYTNKRTT